MDAEQEEAEEDSVEESLQIELDTLTDTLNKLRRTREELLFENEFLQCEAHRAHLDSQVCMSYLSEQTQKCESDIVPQNENKLEALRRQREEALAQYQEEAGELRRLIEEKEGKLAALKGGMPQLGELKGLQQLGCAAVQEKEWTRMQRQHFESLYALKATLTSESQQHKSQAKRQVQAEAREARREATEFLQSYIRNILGEIVGLKPKFQQNMLRVTALKTCQRQLQTKRQELLGERNFTTFFKRPYKPGLSTVQSKGKGQTKMQLEDQANCTSAKTQNEQHPKMVPSGRQTPKSQPAGLDQPQAPKPSEA